MPWPDFLIVGFPKCGTTSLVHNLNAHTDIFVHPRETRYFEKYWHPRWRLGRRYKQLFSSDTLNGEKTPTYVSSPAAMHRIQRHIPNARLIVCIRHPIRVLHSFYHSRVASFLKGRWGIDPQRHPFPDLVQHEKTEKDVGAAMYCFARHLTQNVFSRFDRSQIRIVVQEEMQENASATLQALFRFLGQKPQNVAIGRFSSNDYQMHYPSIDIRAEAYPAAMSKLLRLYARENNALFELLGRDIPAWRTLDERYKELAGS